MAAIEDADRAVAAQAAPLRDAPLVRVLGQVSELADQPPLIAFCTAVILGGLVRRDRRLARAGGRMLASHLLATGLKIAVKSAVDRTRPKAAAEGERYRFEPGHHPHEHALSSFPSGHTAGALAVARAVARDYPATATAGYAATAFVAAIQIPRCTHYPSDIAAGAAIGWAAEAAVDTAVRLISERFPAGAFIR